MNDNMLVSVIVPVYRVEKSRLSAAIRSVTESDIYRNEKCELVVVADGEQEFELIKPFEHMANTAVVIIPHSGVSAARNAGISKASGKWITFLDADDEFCPSGLDLLVEAGEFADADLLFSGHLKARGEELGHHLSPGSFDDGEVISYLHPEKAIWVALRPEADQGTVWAKLFKSSFLFEHNLTFDESIQRSEDQEFIIRVVLSASAIASIDEPTYRYVYSSTSLARAFTGGEIDRVTHALKAIETSLNSVNLAFTDDDRWHEFILDRLLALTVNHVFHPDASFDRSPAAAMQALARTKPYSSSLARGSYENFAPAKRVTLEAIHANMYHVVQLICAIRHAQLKRVSE